MTIGKNIKRFRESLGISISELARRAGHPAATINIIERSNRDPSLKTLKNIAEALKIPIDNLIFEDKIYHNYQKFSAEFSILEKLNNNNKKRKWLRYPI